MDGGCSEHPQISLTERIANARQGCMSCLVIAQDRLLQIARETIQGQGWLTLEDVITVKISQFISTTSKPGATDKQIESYVKSIASTAKADQGRSDMKERYDRDRQHDNASGKIRTRRSQFIGRLHSAGLDSKDMEAARHAYADGKNRKEIAHLMQEPPTRIDQRLRRVRQKLIERPIREQLHKKLDDDLIDLIVALRMSGVFTLRLDVRDLEDGSADARKNPPHFRQRILAMSNKLGQGVPPLLDLISSCLEQLKKLADPSDDLSDLVDDVMDDLRDDLHWAPFELSRGRLNQQATALVDHALRVLNVSPDLMRENSIEVYCMFLRSPLVPMHRTFRDKVASLDSEDESVAQAWSVIAGRIWPARDLTPWLKIAARLWWVQNLQEFGTAYLEQLPLAVRRWYSDTTER